MPMRLMNFTRTRRGTETPEFSVFAKDKRIVRIFLDRVESTLKLESCCRSIKQVVYHGFSSCGTHDAICSSSSGEIVVQSIVCYSISSHMTHSSRLQISRCIASTSSHSSRQLCMRSASWLGPDAQSEKSVIQNAGQTCKAVGGVSHAVHGGAQPRTADYQGRTIQRKVSFYTQSGTTLQYKGKTRQR